MLYISKSKVREKPDMWHIYFFSEISAFSSHFRNIRRRNREQKYIIPAHPKNNAKLPIMTRLRPEEEAMYKIQRCRTTIKTVVGKLAMLKRTAFFKSCFVLH